LRDKLSPVVTLYIFLLIVGAVGALAYVLLFFSHVPGAKDERLGKLEELPADLGTWTKGTGDDGMIVERRYLLADPSGMDEQNLVIQVRYRDPDSSEIVRVDPEQKYRRKRVRS
jgi:hypothetical protein